MEVVKIKEELKLNLSEYRYLHSIHTAEVARSLAKHYGVDEEKAYLAGLVHDVAKEFSDDENEAFIKEHHLPLSLLNEENKKFLHGQIGAIIARKRYSFPTDVCDAICYHVAGRENMTKLEKVVYLADKIEPGKSYPKIDRERELAYLDLNEAIIFCLKEKIEKLKRKGKKIYPITLLTLASLEKKKEKC